MENWLLIAVGIIFLISIIWGLSQGMLRIAVSLAATIITVVVVSAFAPKVSQMIQEHTTIDDSISKAVTAVVRPAQEQENQEDDAQQEQTPSLEEQEQSVNNSNLPTFLQSSTLEYNSSENYLKLGADSFYNYVGNYIAATIVNILSFLILYAVLRIFVRILMNMIDVISELPVLHGVNRLAGGVVGIGVGLIAVWLLFLVVTLFYATSLGQSCFRQIEANEILNILYQKNYILHFLSSVK
jgi:hypothetical protein